MQNALRFLMKKRRVLSLRVITFDPLKKEKKNTHINGKKTCLFHQKSEGILHLLFAGIALRSERLNISSEIKGNFNLDGNVLEIALQKCSALRFERLKIIHLFKNQGKKQYIFQTKFFPSVCPRYALIQQQCGHSFKHFKPSTTGEQTHAWEISSLPI